VDVVANGREAVELVKDLPYDLVLMDCQMPVMDGYQAAIRIRRLDGAAGTVPIIAVTAGTLGGGRARCLAAGMDDYVAKPVDGERLAPVLERRLGVRRTAAGEPVGSAV
jgi:CheY-like chemotaxis protein